MNKNHATQRTRTNQLTQVGAHFAAWLLLMTSTPLLAQASDASIGLTLSTAPTDKRMAFSFQDVPVRALLQVLGETAGVNIVANESVTGTMTLNLKDATWQEALAVIVKAKNLTVEKSNNTYFVTGDSVMLSEQGYDDGTNSYGMQSYGRVDTIVLQYQKAESVRKMILESQRLLSPQGAVMADPLSNQLIVQDTPDRVAQIRGLIKRIDQPARQVLIEARIVEADDSFSRSLGMKLSFNDLTSSGFQSVPNPTNPSQNIQIPTRSQGNNTYFGSNQSFGAAIASAAVDPASYAVSVFRSGLSQFINLEISALEVDGLGKVISSPRVVTSNNVKALIEQGTEIPYQESTSSGATSTSFRKANLKLEVTPQITPNGDVVMDVDVAKDSIGSLVTDAGYTINTKHVQTQVKVENGGTLVIGGIYQEASNNSENKVPLLGDIPLLGYLFKRTDKSVSKTELLIFLTPYVLDAKGKPTALPNLRSSESP
jgi:type IV pilus assembly protein PilQ